MKKDLKKLNRSLALAIAAAMALTSAPSAVFAEDVFSDSAEVVDVETADVSAESEEAVVDAEADVAEVEVTDTEDIEITDAADVAEETTAEAVEEEVVDDLFTAEADTANADATTAKGTAGTPVQVTGVRVIVDGELVSEPTLAWNYVAGAYGYRIAVKDSAGNEYKNYSGEDYLVGYNYSMPEVYLNNVLGSVYLATKNADGTYTRTSKSAWQAGQTYTITVSAVNKYSATGSDSDAVETPGPASEAVTYTVPTTASQLTITDLTYVDQSDDYVYFTYTGDITVGDLALEISTNTDFTDSVYYWTTTDDTYKLCISTYYMDDGKTYYVRVGNRVDGYLPKDASGNDVWSNVVSFTKNTTTPKNITGLALEKETRNYYKFTFDAVLESSDDYVLEYSTDSTFTTDFHTSDDDDNNYIYKSSLTKGKTYYVRAYSYINNDRTKKGAYSNTVTINYAAAPTITDLTVAEKTSKYFVLKYTGSLDAYDGVQVWISSDSSFPSDETKTFISYESNENSIYVYYKNVYDYNNIFTPGVTYYVKARAYSYSPDLEDDYKDGGSYYGTFTNVVTLTPTVPTVDVEATVDKTSVRLSMDSSNHEYGYFCTGYTVQRKSGKKWITVSRNTSGIYTDSNLKQNTSYTYRVRAYYRDTDTNKSYNGEWTYYTASTWGGNLNLQAVPASKTSVKLTWSKITGAKGYEIYRSVTTSSAYQYQNGGVGENSYTKYKLVKTIKKASAKSYTIKKLTSGVEYSFIVRAYKTVNGKKVYIEDSSSCSLAFDSVDIYKTKVDATGNKTITWKPVYAANGYLIEKYNETTNTYETYQTITKVKNSSVTLKAGTETETYRIRAYKNGSPKIYSTGVTVDVEPKIAAATGVKATVSGESIVISWNAVSGADYYEVRRTTNGNYTYNKDSKSYTYSDNYTVVYEYVADTTTKSGYKKNSELTTTTVTDKKVTYTNAYGIEVTLNKGPEADQTYYYYVVAYKNNTSDGIYKSTSATEGRYSKAASAKITATKVSKPTLKSVKATKGKVTIKWKKVSGATGYQIYRSTKKNSGYMLVGSVSSGSTVKYVDKTTTKGKKYYYKVRATKTNEVGADEISSYSKAKSVKAK